MIHMDYLQGDCFGLMGLLFEKKDRLPGLF